MSTFLVAFWAGLIIASIAWYGFLVFYVGLKAGKEIREMTDTLSKQQR
jgi:hypothetical protein